MPDKRQQKARLLQVAGLSCYYQRQRRKTLCIRLDADGDVWIACPWYLPEFFIRRAVEERFAWIQERRRQVQQSSLRRAEALFFHLGKAYRVQHKAVVGRARVELQSDLLLLHLPEGTPRSAEELLVQRWQRRELQRLLPDLISRWEKKLGVQVADWGIRRMRTRWGTCNTTARRLWFRLALIEEPLDCIEYVVAHECAHLLERQHNARFYALLESHLPYWRELERALQQRDS
ncbi:M48 family metallopeptidase [Acidithiobacillus sp. IBUN Pt1247-S3]|uniref:M48 family metallopeptidase n=1 Tax=Acidithiobacillus sp. IBUN Pt1247-S3 TaxID=3166642 RepID=UPI0034E54960